MERPTEGASDDPAIVRLRSRRQRSLIAALLLSQGVPMILHGDEPGRTPQSNNNAYAQDSEPGWINWEGADKDLLDFAVTVRRCVPPIKRFTAAGSLDGRAGQTTGRWPGAGYCLADAGWHSDGTFGLNPRDCTGGGDVPDGIGIRCSDLTGSQMTDSDFILYFNTGSHPRNFTLPPAWYALHGELVLDASPEGTVTGMVADGALVVPPYTLLVLRQQGGVVHADDHDDEPASFVTKILSYPASGPV